MSLKSFRDVFAAAASGCNHDFSSDGIRDKARFDMVACHLCGLQATAGEIAWMLFGGKAVENYQIAQQQLLELPAEGGLH